MNEENQPKGIAREFLEAYIDALPKDLGRDFNSLQVQLGVAIGAGLEAVAWKLASHVHYHVKPGQELTTIGNITTIHDAADVSLKAPPEEEIKF